MPGKQLNATEIAALMAEIMKGAGDWKVLSLTIDGISLTVKREENA